MSRKHLFLSLSFSFTFYIQHKDFPNSHVPNFVPGLLFAFKRESINEIYTCSRSAQYDIVYLIVYMYVCMYVYARTIDCVCSIIYYCSISMYYLYLLSLCDRLLTRIWNRTLCYSAHIAIYIYFPLWKKRRYTLWFSSIDYVTLEKEKLPIIYNFNTHRLHITSRVSYFQKCSEHQKRIAISYRKHLERAAMFLFHGNVHSTVVCV